MHLDYVGHAAVTDRLLEVDPEYTYRLLATNPDGSPVVFTAETGEHEEDTMLTFACEG
jgi:hypothetical protein